MFSKASEGGIIALLGEIRDSASCPDIGDAHESIVSIDEVHIISLHAESVELRSRAVKEEGEVIFRSPDGA